MVLNTERAQWLALAYGDAAYECDRARRDLIRPLASAAELTGQAELGTVDGLARLGEQLRAEQRDIEARIRMVLLGGEVVNAGLWALDVVERHYATFDVGRDGDPATADGIVSRADLEAVAATGSGEVAAAAAFLLAHQGFLATVDDAEENVGYLDSITDASVGGRFASGSADGRFDRDDIDAYRRKLSDWATILPFAAQIDVAAQGDPTRADGHLSADDFAAIVDDPETPIEVREAAERVLADEAFHTRSGIDWGRVGFEALDAASYLPVVGEAVDAGRAAWYAAHGDWVNATIYAGGLVPIPGVTGSGVRATREAVDLFRRVAADEGMEAAVRLGARETAQGLGTYTAVTGATWAADQVTDNETVTTVVGEGTAVATRRRLPAPGEAEFDGPGP